MDKEFSWQHFDETKCFISRLVRHDGMIVALISCSEGTGAEDATYQVSPFGHYWTTKYAAMREAEELSGAVANAG